MKAGRQLVALALLTIAAAVSAAPQAKSQRFLLVNKGRPACAIVIPEKASPIERRAAEILQSSVRKMSGAFLLILEKRKPGPNNEISIGFAGDAVPKDLSSAATRLREDGFLVACAGKNLYVLWDYTVNFSHNVSPFPNLHVLQPNLRFFVRNGARQHFQQTNTSPGHEFSELKSYLLARLLWNPDTDADAVTTEFLNGYYGAAGPSIRKYIAALEAALARSGARLDIYEPPVAHGETYLSRGNVAAYNDLFDRAQAAVSGDDAVLERVKTARLPLQYAMLEIGKNDMFGPRGFYVEREGRFELRPEMKRLLEEFYGTCTRNGVRTLNESGLTPSAYYDAALRFVDVQVEGNLAFRKLVVADPPPSPKYGKGDVTMLANGVRGANDFRVHWLGWEGVDFDLTLDLGAAAAPREVSLGTLYDPHSWILHPRRVTCYVSADGSRFQEIGTLTVEGDQRKEDVTRTFSFKLPVPDVRFIRVHVEGTKQLPDWHASAGGMSWVFVDEIVAR